MIGPIFVMGGTVLSMVMAVQERAPGYRATWIFLMFCALILVAQLVPLCKKLLKRTGRQQLEQAEEVVHNRQK